MYRSGQRGWLEVDLLLGKWAAENVPTMTDAQLAEYESILNRDTIDIFKIVSGQTSLPESEMNPTIQKLKDYAKSQPLGRNHILPNMSLSFHDEFLVFVCGIYMGRQGRPGCIRSCQEVLF